jgi:hypothetical protein
MEPESRGRMLKFFNLGAPRSPSLLLRSTHPYFCPGLVEGDAGDTVLAGLDPELSPIQIVALCANYRELNEAEWDEVVWLWTRRPRAWLRKAFVRQPVACAASLITVSIALVFMDEPFPLLAYWLLLLLVVVLLTIQETTYRRWHADYCAAVRRAL